MKINYDVIKVNQELVEAIKNSNIKQAEEILLNCINSNVFISWPTLLDTVIKQNQNKIEMVRLLLENGLNPNMDGYRLLNSIVYFSRKITEESKEIIKLLVKYGADVNYHPKGYIAPTIAALTKGAYDIAKLFLEHGADYDLHELKVSFEESLEYYETKTRENSIARYEILEFLLEKGVSFNNDNTNDSILDKLLRRNQESENLELAKLLITKGGVNYNKHGIHLHDLILFSENFEENRDIVEFLVEKGMDINRYYNGLTLLDELISTQHFNILSPSEFLNRTKFLLQKGAHITQEYIKNLKFTQLRQDAVKLFLSYGLEPSLLKPKENMDSDPWIEVSRTLHDICSLQESQDLMKIFERSCEVDSIKKVGFKEFVTFAQDYFNNYISGPIRGNWPFKENESYNSLVIELKDLCLNYLNKAYKNMQLDLEILEANIASLHSAGIAIMPYSLFVNKTEKENSIFDLSYDLSFIEEFYAGHNYEKAGDYLQIIKAIKDVKGIPFLNFCMTQCEEISNLVYRIKDYKFLPEELYIPLKEAILIDKSYTIQTKSLIQDMEFIQAPQLDIIGDDINI